MKINSSFKDYYDSVSVSDYESELTYIRRSNYMIPCDAIKNMIGNINSKLNAKCPYRRYCIVHINGKYHLGFLVKNQMYYDIHKFDNKENTFNVYKQIYAEFDKLKTNLPALSVPISIIMTYAMLMDMTYQDIKMEHSLIHEFQCHVKRLKPDVNSYDLARYYIQWDNPKLSIFQFFKVLDAYHLVQELEMYLMNQINPENDMIEISNKDKIVQHGFDLKTSFRKCKQK